MAEESKSEGQRALEASTHFYKVPCGQVDPFDQPSLLRGDGSGDYRRTCTNDNLCVACNEISILREAYRSSREAERKARDGYTELSAQHQRLVQRASNGEVDRLGLVTELNAATQRCRELEAKVGRDQVSVSEFVGEELYAVEVAIVVDGQAYRTLVNRCYPANGKELTIEDAATRAFRASLRNVKQYHPKKGKKT